MWLLAWIVYLVAVPIGYMIVDSLTEDGLSLDNFRDFLADRKLLTAATNSLLVAAGVALLSALVGVPLAFGVVLTDMPGKRVA